MRCSSLFQLVVSRSVKHSATRWIPLSNHRALTDATGGEREPLLGPAGEIQMQLTMDLPDPLLVPRLPVEPEPPEAFPDAPVSMHGHKLGQRLNDWRILTGPIHRRSIEQGVRHS